MTFILNIYIKDTRTQSGRRMIGSYAYERKDREEMDREVERVRSMYEDHIAHTFEVIAEND